MDTDDTTPVPGPRRRTRTQTVALTMLGAGYGVAVGIGVGLVLVLSGFADLLGLPPILTGGLVVIVTAETAWRSVKYLSRG